MAGSDFRSVKLVDRIDLSDELAIFKLEYPGQFNFIPGQYATLALTDGDKLIQRPYSIASSPYDYYLEFFIELVPNGDLTPRLWQLKPGASIYIRNRVAGRFTLDRKSRLNSHLMIATVTGIAPFVSMIRTYYRDFKNGKDEGLRFAVIHGASRSWELSYYQEEFYTLMKLVEWVSYVPTISRWWEDTGWRGELGRVEDIVRKYTDGLNFDYQRAVAYLCGHPQMIENAKDILARARFSREQIHEEKYFVIKEGK